MKDKNLVIEKILDIFRLIHLLDYNNLTVSY